MSHRLRIGFSLSCLLFANSLFADDVKMEFIAKGVTQRVGGYRPVRAEMDQESSIAKKIPEDFSAPKFGVFKFGDKEWIFVLDEPEEGDQRIVVDTNQDGDLTNDPEAVWKAGAGKMYNGQAEVDLGNGQLGRMNMYRFDPTEWIKALYDWKELV